MRSQRIQNRAYGHGKFGRCGKDDRGAALEFQHLDLEVFNRALDKFLEKRDPDYHKRKAFAIRGRKEVDKA